MHTISQLAVPNFESYSGNQSRSGKWGLARANVKEIHIHVAAKRESSVVEAFSTKSHNVLSNNSSWVML